MSATIKLESKRPAARRQKFRRRRRVVTLSGIVAAIGAGAMPLISAMAPSGPPLSSASVKSVKEFSVPISDLTRWSQEVIDTLPGVVIGGNSKVHDQSDDCEMHFGAQSPAYQGDPSGLVLEPMNCCSIAFPGTVANPTPEGTPQADKQWLEFAKKIKGKEVTAIGVPRIWPEHLAGGNEPSNPNHAVELHPLTGLKFAGDEYDFSHLVSAGTYHGGVSAATAASILKKTRVLVSRQSSMAKVRFMSGTIGNFTLLDIDIDRASIADDGAGSFRAMGAVHLDDGTSVPVRIACAKDSLVNEAVGELRSSAAANVTLSSLVLFSLSPKALLSAAEASNGEFVNVERPIQLILYGPVE